jgi:hypothetical protein
MSPASVITVVTRLPERFIPVTRTPCAIVTPPARAPAAKALVRLVGST